MMSETQEIGDPPGTEGNKPEVTAAVTHLTSTIQQVESGASVSSSSPVASMIQTPATTATEDEDESEDESEILEESPCGRWQKRKEEVGMAGKQCFKMMDKALTV